MEGMEAVGILWDPLAVGKGQTLSLHPKLEGHLRGIPLALRGAPVPSCGRSSA